MAESKSFLMIGFIIGLILVLIPEPSTTATGLLILAGTSVGMGWMD